MSAVLLCWRLGRPAHTCVACATVCAVPGAGRRTSVSYNTLQEASTYARFACAAYAVQQHEDTKHRRKRERHGDDPDEDIEVPALCLPLHPVPQNPDKASRQVECPVMNR